MKILKRFWPLFTPHYKYGAGISLVLLLSTIVTVGTPYFYKELVDNGISRGNGTYIAQMLAVIVAAMALTELLYLAQRHLTLHIRKLVFTKLRTDLFAHVLTLPQTFFAGHSGGKLLSRLTSDVDAVQNLLLEKYIYFVQNLLVGLSIFVVIFTVNWHMVFFAGLFLPLLYLLYLLFRTKLSQLSRKSQEQQERMMERLQEDLTNVKAIQSYGAYGERVRQARGIVLDAEDAKKRLNMRYAWASSATAIINAAGVVIIWGVGGMSVLQGTMSLGTLIAISFYLNHVVHMFFNAYYTVLGFQTSLPAARRIFDVLDEPSPADGGPDAVRIDGLRESVEFRDVSFAYDGNRPVFAGARFRLVPGDLVGVVGNSGQGKTTLVHLLMRFYDPDSGTIEWDGRDARTIALDSLRRTIVNVPQEDDLFDMSVRDNIVIGRSGVTEERFLRACRLANVDAFAAALPEGYDTIVGENGRRLSTGQRKRVAIARALLDDPAVLVLDEATSVLDEHTESDILAEVKRLAGSRIVLIVTHNVSNVRDANKWLHVDGGTVTMYESFEEYRYKVLMKPGQQ